MKNSRDHPQSHPIVSSPEAIQSNVRWFSYSSIWVYHFPYPIFRAMMKHLVLLVFCNFYLSFVYIISLQTGDMDNKNLTIGDVTAIARLLYRRFLLYSCEINFVPGNMWVSFPTALLLDFRVSWTYDMVGNTMFPYYIHFLIICVCLLVAEPGACCLLKFFIWMGPGFLYILI